MSTLANPGTSEARRHGAAGGGLFGWVDFFMLKPRAASTPHNAPDSACI